MKYIYLFVLIFLSITTQSRVWAQTPQASLQGKIADTTNYRPMAYASVSLIRLDSTLAYTQFAGHQSDFHFKEIKPDTYHLLITRPGYADYEEDITLASGESKNLGTIVLLSRENLLREVLVKDFSAIKIKGDTTEFRVDSFLVNKNSNVEDLLKRLPGIQVDKNGKITAQGQEVKRVLVDGEEFFGNDPTLATKNIRADNVETVQVFDRKSDQAIETGVDDGNKEKTINLTLKDEAKKGYFGKADAGYGTKNDSKIEGLDKSYGTENRYNGELMYNNFKNKRKASVVSTFGNTPNTELSWEDREKYMGGNNVEFDDVSGYMFSYFEWDPNGYNGNGIPQSRMVGGNYSDKLYKEKLGLNLTATYKELNIKGADKNYSQYIMPDTMYFNTQLNLMDNHRTNAESRGKLEYKIDSLTTFTVKANLTQSRFDNNNVFVSENYNGYSQKVNSNERTNLNNGTQTKGDYSLYLNGKFKKTGRMASILFDHKINNGNSDGTLVSKTTYYLGDSLNTIGEEQLLNQYKTSEETGNTLGSKLTYVEPLSKKLSLVTDYDFHLTRNHSLIRTFNKSPSGGYTQIVDSLSNDLNYDINIHKGGVSMRYVDKKWNVVLGGRASYTNLTQKNAYSNLTQEQHFRNYYPAASVNYKLGTTKNLRFSYNGQTRQPTLQMINPIQDLSNPLVIYKGNPALGQMFDNDLNLSYSSFKALTNRNLYASLNYSYTFNDFSNYDEVDEKGRKIYKTVNVDGNQNWYLYSNYYFKIPSLHLNVGQGLSGSYYKRANYINTLYNVNNSTSLTYFVDLSYSIDEKLDINFNPEISYNRSTTSLRPDVLTKYYTGSLYGYINIYLPKKMEWFIDGRYNMRQKTDVFTNNRNTFIVSAFVSRKFLKEENLEVRFSVEDLLNQNIGFERTANSNYINENTYIVLRRYFMINVIYNFTNQASKEK